MSHSLSSRRWLPIAAAAAVCAAAACGDTPAGPDSSPVEAFNHSNGHSGPKSGGPTVMASVILQPEVSATDDGRCAVRWGFQFEGKGQPRWVRWTQETLSSDHNPAIFTDVVRVGNGVDPTILVHGRIHDGDGHLIDSIRLRVIPEGDDPADPTTVYGEAATDSFTWTCG